MYDKIKPIGRHDFHKCWSFRWLIYLISVLLAAQNKTNEQLKKLMDYFV